jgi:nucleoside-diphosphate-sugar epimerase
MSLNIIVTGCAGYIGTTLVPHLLSRGHSVCGIDSLLHGGEGMLGFMHHPGFGFIKEDIRETGVLATALALAESSGGVDAIIHLAALVGEPACAKDPDEAYAVNTTAVKHLVDISKEYGVGRFLLASTCSNYGIQDPSTLATEETDLYPTGVYSRSKVDAESIILQTRGVDTTILRFATVFGLSPRMRFDLLLNELCRDAVEKRYLDIWGPDSWRPFVHVQDLARAVRLMLEQGSTGIYNIGGLNVQKRTLAEILGVLVPDLEVDFTKGKTDPRDYRVSFNRLRYTQVCGLEDGIEEVVHALNNGFFDDPFSRRYRNV